MPLGLHLPLLDDIVMSHRQGKILESTTNKGLIHATVNGGWQRESHGQKRVMVVTVTIAKGAVNEHNDRPACSFFGDFCFLTLSMFHTGQQPKSITP
jgi:hypothetical protein